jgi:hypothetical protein
MVTGTVASHFLFNEDCCMNKEKNVESRARFLLSDLMVSESRGNDDNYGNKNQQWTAQKLVSKRLVSRVDAVDQSKHQKHRYKS